MGKTKRIPQSKVDYIVANMDKVSRYSLSRDTGVSVSSLYRIIREQGEVANNYTDKTCYDRVKRNIHNLNNSYNERNY